MIYRYYGVSVTDLVGLGVLESVGVGVAVLVAVGVTLGVGVIDGVSVAEGVKVGVSSNPLFSGPSTNSWAVLSRNCKRPGISSTVK